MDKINWKQKLTSRKFWAALIGFVTAVLYAFNVAETNVTQIAGIITAGSTLVIYILTEGYVDANRDNNVGNTYNTYYPPGLLDNDEEPPLDALV